MVNNKNKSQSLGNLKLGEKKYTVHNEEEKIVFKDTTNKGVQVDFSFSKDKRKNKLAKEGWREFWTDLYR